MRGPLTTAGSLLYRELTMSETPRFLDFRGWRFFAPFICMGCGVVVDARQWAFSRSCSACDVSRSRTRRLLYHRCFAGKRERLPASDRFDIPESDFVDPKDRDKHAVICKPQPRRPPRLRQARS